MDPVPYQGFYEKKMEQKSQLNRNVSLKNAILAHLKRRSLLPSTISLNILNTFF
jgi:hypothetical protein